MSRLSKMPTAELLWDGLSAPCVPAGRSAGWKRDQHLRRPGALRLAFIGEVVDAPRVDLDGQSLSLPPSMAYVRR
jgi:hypothetical protein